jgi:hypothetical protein
MNTQTELLLDYQEMAIVALRKEVQRLTMELKEIEAERQKESEYMSWLEKQYEQSDLYIGGSLNTNP